MQPKEVLIVEDNKNVILAATASGGHVLKVKDVHEVTYKKIKNRIKQVEG